MFDYFFTPDEEIPTNLGWQAYGPEHLAWLGAMFVIGFFACRYFKKQSPEKQTRLLKYFAVYLLFQEILKDFIYWEIGSLGLRHLPLHMCGISIFFCLWYAFKGGEVCEAYIYGMNMPGALSALLFPNWTNLPLIHFSSWNSFTIHAMLILFTMLNLTSGRLVPKMRTLPKLILALFAMAIPIYFLNKVWDTNFMFLNTPSEGSPLIPLYSLFGEGYVIAFAVMVISILALLFLPWEILRRRKEAKA